MKGTLIFYIKLCFFCLVLIAFLCAVEEHYNLRCEMPGKASQLSFEKNRFGDKCIVYREDFVTKTHNGGLNDMRHECKECWVFPNKNTIDRCPAHLIEKYISLCPKNNVKKRKLLSPITAKAYDKTVVWGTSCRYAYPI